ncbi:MAG: nitrate reductase molybdenum cofactor assembly chaperone [Rhodospirillaceae bacterium]|nr:MAG: nitrate reductase molybdenum cofactor assembly chaperone [Rhodospirillaceae bacterium]
MMKTYKILSALLGYPDVETLAYAEAMPEILRQENLLPAEQQAAVGKFATTLARYNLLDLQEQYVALFDRNRSLSLHLYEHVHGESRDRGEAMVQLSELYHLHGLEISARELPDYLPLFLEFLSLLPAGAAASLLSEAVHVVAALREKLRQRGSDYALLLEAIESLAAKAPDVAAVAEVLSTLQPEADGLAALDRQWEEEAVRFTAAPRPDGTGAASACGR